MGSKFYQKVFWQFSSAVCASAFHLGYRSMQTSSVWTSHHQVNSKSFLTEFHAVSLGKLAHYQVHLCENMSFSLLLALAHYSRQIWKMTWVLLCLPPPALLDLNTTTYFFFFSFVARSDLWPAIFHSYKGFLHLTYQYP